MLRLMIETEPKCLIQRSFHAADGSKDTNFNKGDERENEVRSPGERASDDSADRVMQETISMKMVS